MLTCFHQSLLDAFTGLDAELESMDRLCAWHGSHSLGHVGNVLAALSIPSSVYRISSESLLSGAFAAARISTAWCLIQYNVHPVVSGGHTQMWGP